MQVIEKLFAKFCADTEVESLPVDEIKRRTLLRGAAVMGGGFMISTNLVGCVLTESIATTDTQPDSAASSLDGASSFGTLSLSDEKVPAITATGSYVGNGSSLQIWVGFKPDLVVICPLIGKAVTYVTPTTWNGRTSYFAELGFGGGPTRPRGIVLGENGFSVGSLADVNSSGAGFHWFAYKDNDSESIFDGDYRGSPTYMTPRTVELFKGKNIRAAILKRDNNPSAAHMYLGNGAADYKGNPVGATLNSDSTFTIGDEPIVNTGESCNVLAFPDNAPNTYVFKYVGSGVARFIPLPWEADALIFLPLTPAIVRGGVWISGLGTQYKPMSNSTALSGALSLVSGTSIGLTASNNLNEKNVTYICYAFKRARGTLAPEIGKSYKTSQTIMTASDGYIDCGTDDSLNISGAITIEILCAHNQTDTTVFAGPNYNNEIGKQSPLVFRSDGADGVMGSISFGLSVISQWPTTWSVGVSMPFPSITWAQSPIWQIWNGSISQQKCPIMSGIGSAAYLMRHYILTHDGHGKWRLYLDGVLVKECNDDLSKDPASGGVPPSNIVGGVGHRLIFGARKREKVEIEHRNMLQLKEARIYRRELTAEEALNNYDSIWNNGPSATPDFAEQWLASNTTGGVMNASLNSANNGLIVNGSVYG